MEKKKKNRGYVAWETVKGERHVLSFFFWCEACKRGKIMKIELEKCSKVRKKGFCLRV